MTTKTEFLYEDLSYKLVGCFYAIRNEYGPGHKEGIYKNLIVEQLAILSIPVETEVSIPIYSNQTKQKVGLYRPDLIVNNKIIVEIKSTVTAAARDEKQLYYYLRNSQFEVGYLVNFSTPNIYIHRIIYSNHRKPFLAKSA